MICISNSDLTSSLNLRFLIRYISAVSIHLKPKHRREDNIKTDHPGVLTWTGLNWLRNFSNEEFFFFFLLQVLKAEHQNGISWRECHLDLKNGCTGVTGTTSTFYPPGHCTRVPLWSYSWAAPIHVLVTSEIQHCLPYKYSSRLTGHLTTIVLLLHSVNHLFNYGKKKATFLSEQTSAFRVHRYLRQERIEYVNSQQIIR
jgi:hypothetical protein